MSNQNPKKLEALPRRRILLAASGAGLAYAAGGSLLLGGCQRPRVNARSNVKPAEPARVLEVEPLGRPPWKTFDPFLFCVHHDDSYPSGNAELGPNASLAGRSLGNDFEAREGWRMYHGHVVPGFPRHPHRGFETVTVTRRGHIDHSDSLGATARYGNGDVQWMTAGRGIVHAEMFPLLDAEQPNHTELFQIWINLPGSQKFVPPHFSMFWSDSVPRAAHADAKGRTTRSVFVAGAHGEQKSPAPPPNSWAARPESEVAIWTLTLDPHAELELPAAAPDANRTLYVFSGGGLKVGEREVPTGMLARVRPDWPTLLVNGAQLTEVLMLQGRPIGEPVVSYGPFVMNDREQIQQAFQDYRKDGFGGWPWPNDAPVHARDSGRFAVHADGRVEHA
jgi:hypothetical protein